MFNKIKTRSISFLLGLVLSIFFYKYKGLLYNYIYDKLPFLQKKLIDLEIKYNQIKQAYHSEPESDSNLDSDL